MHYGRFWIAYVKCRRRLRRTNLHMQGKWLAAVSETAIEGNAAALAMHQLEVWASKMQRYLKQAFGRKNVRLNVRDTERIVCTEILEASIPSQVFERYLVSRGVAHSFRGKGNPYGHVCKWRSVCIMERKNVKKLWHTYLTEVKEKRTTQGV